jgi:2-amino-4-hydroxy-6-hydroxymethyldihydropteridine diphosphokinase
MSKVYLLLGANIGNKNDTFRRAAFIIESVVGQIIMRSSVYETEPWGFQSDDFFWNQVLVLRTSLPALDILQHIQKTERALGRIRKQSGYESRSIDIDILFYDDQIIDQPDLTVPHPRIQERNFVLAPLNEVAPGLVHPILKKTIGELYRECPDKLNVRKLDIN